MESNSLERFFQSWSHSISTGNVPAQVSHFAEVFMVAGPQGTQSVRASDFALALPKRKQLFGSLGCQSSTLVSLIESKLNDRYSTALTQWRFTFAKNGANPQQVLVDSTYIVDTGADAFKIVFYLPHQDIMAILKDRGILPN
jgi:hypothetical protein